MGFSPFFSGGPLLLLKTTGVGGFALENGTPSIVNWTPPADGLMHRVLVIIMGDVTAATTGGSVWCSGKLPDGTAFSAGLDNGSHAGTGYTGSTTKMCLVQAGELFNVYQASALTAGAATFWVELWGS